MPTEIQENNMKIYIEKNIDDIAEISWLVTDDVMIKSTSVCDTMATMLLKKHKYDLLHALDKKLKTTCPGLKIYRSLWDSCTTDQDISFLMSIGMPFIYSAAIASVVSENMFYDIISSHLYVVNGNAVRFMEDVCQTLICHPKMENIVDRMEKCTSRAFVKEMYDYVWHVWLDNHHFNTLVASGINVIARFLIYRFDEEKYKQFMEYIKATSCMRDVQLIGTMRYGLSHGVSLLKKHIDYSMYAEEVISIHDIVRSRVTNAIEYADWCRMYLYIIHVMDKLQPETEEIRKIAGRFSQSTQKYMRHDPKWKSCLDARTDIFPMCVSGSVDNHRRRMITKLIHY